MTAAIPASLNGVLVVDKPQGPTSFQIVSQARRLFGTKSVGHAGTLDPMATGVLLVLIGEATKLSAYLTAASKCYRATVTFGLSTDSFDAEGSPTDRQTLTDGWLDPQALEQAIEVERRRTTQLPPVFSAIKVDGRPAYALARSGQAPELATRPVAIESLKVLEWSAGELSLQMHVSKGYYVRSLVRDLCATLGVPGHLSQLRRTASGDFQLAEAREWPPDGPPPPLMPVALAARRGIPTVTLQPEAVILARQGKLLSTKNFLSPPPESGVFGWMDAENLIAIGEAVDGMFRVRRGFNA